MYDGRNSFWIDKVDKSIFRQHATMFIFCLFRGSSIVVCIFLMYVVVVAVMGERINLEVRYGVLFSDMEMV